LRREVEELLRYDGAAESFIEKNALAFEARRLEPDELSQTAPQLIRKLKRSERSLIPAW
jgi:hypothetical protein